MLGLGTGRGRNRADGVSNMPNDEPVDGRCNAQTRDGGYCANHPVEGAERCRMHGGQSTGPPEGTANAAKHNLRADKKKWFERQDEETQEDVLQLWETYLERANDPDGSRSILWDAAVNEVILGDADEYLAEEGFIVESVVDVDDQGNPITKEKENPALMPRSRMQKDTLRILKDTGVLSAAEDRKADQMGSLAMLLSDEE